jgi:hypothetical protein
VIMESAPSYVASGPAHRAVRRRGQTTPCLPSLALSSLSALTSAFHTRRINLLKTVGAWRARSERASGAGRRARTPHHGSKLRIQSCTFKTYMHMYEVRQGLTAHRPYIHYEDEVLFSWQVSTKQFEFNISTYITERNIFS